MNREDIIDKLAQNSTDNMDLDNLLEFFYNDQYNYYDSLSDASLIVDTRNCVPKDISLLNKNCKVVKAWKFYFLFYL